MLVVRVELHSAITGIVTEIARMNIWNSMEGTREIGHYECATLRGRSKSALDKRTVQREGEVRNHPRLREHVWCLVSKALKSMGYGEPVEDDFTKEET